MIKLYFYYYFWRELEQSCCLLVQWFALCAWVFLAFFFRWDWRAWLLFVCCWILSGFFLLFLGGHRDIWKVLMQAERTRRWPFDRGSNRCKRLSYVVQILIWNLIFQFQFYCMYSKRSNKIKNQTIWKKNIKALFDFTG